MIEGNDGGANISVDGGETWDSEMNQPTAQFYHIAADNEFRSASTATSRTIPVFRSRQPGAQAKSASRIGIGRRRRERLHHSDPTDANIVYGGGYERRADPPRPAHRPKHQITPWPRNTMGWAAENLKYRFQWTAPIVIGESLSS